MSYPQFFCVTLRKTSLLCLLLIAFAFGKTVSGASGRIDTNFYPIIDGDGTIHAIAIQPDGKILIGGLISRVNGEEQTGIARLNPNGSVDSSFSPDPSLSNNLVGTVYDIEIQADNKILIVGTFSAGSEQTRNGIARLNPDGSLDLSFNAMSGADSAIRSLAYQPDGKIIVAGDFYTFNGVVRNGLVRLNSNGSIDDSFINPRPSLVNSVALQADGKILIAGRFGYVGDYQRGRVARLNSDGTVDTSFLNGLSGANNDITTIHIQADGKILVGGDFTSFNSVTRNRIARLNVDGSIDQTFQSNLSGADRFVNSLVQQPDGKILVGGHFSTINGLDQNKIARLNNDGSLDSSFESNSNDALDYINAVAVQSDGKILIGGSFYFISRALRQGFARLNSNGSLDPTLSFIQLGESGTIRNIARQSDGKILVSGEFRYINGVYTQKFGRFNSDGSLDSTFSIGERNFDPNDEVNTIVPLPDGKILIGGNFDIYVPEFGGYNNLVRLNSTGSVDTSFKIDFSPNNIESILVQSDGKIVVAGNFRSSYMGQIRDNLIRLNVDGSVDTSFLNNLQGPNSFLFSALIQPDGKIVIAGSFTQINGVPRNTIARLNGDGTLDTTFQTFNPGFGLIRDIERQPDGKLIIGGDFRSIRGVTRNNIARLNSDGSLDTSFLNNLSGANGEVTDIAINSNGQVLIAGSFTNVNGVSRKIARLNNDGSLDNSFNFNLAPTKAIAHTLLIEPNGNLIVGGYFNKVNGIIRSSLFRVIQNTQLYDFDGDGKSDVSVFRPEGGGWHLMQSRSGYAAPQFGLSTDKLVPADYDGDGKTDLAVFRENSPDAGRAKFYIMHSSNGQFREELFGLSGDIPVSGDWDGDGKADIGVYRAGTQNNPQGSFFYRPSSQPNIDFVPYPWGIAGDKPVVADFDGDGKTDPAVFRPSNGAWYIQQSRDGFYAIQFGLAEDKPVVGDYDGDGRADQAVFRPSNGVWYLWNSTTGFSAAQFGISTDKPSPADYDGDGKTDLAVYRDGTWFILNSTSGFTAFGFGTATDKPVPHSFVP